jgi:hypothetical protein
MKPLNVVIGFIPQVVFILLINWLPLGGAAAVGLAVAVALIAITAARGGVKVLPVVQALILAVFTVAGFTMSHHDVTTFEPYARGVASLALAAFILATSVSHPFTAQFARAGVPRQYWRSPQFLGVNRRISVAWGLAVLAVGVAHLVAARVGGDARVVRILLDWGVPAVALYRAYSVTKHAIAESAHPTQPEDAGQPAAPPTR